MKQLLVITFSLLLSSTVLSQDLPCKAKYYNNRCKERYQEDSDGQRHGKFISYNEDGTVNVVAHYSHGKLNGIMTEHFGWGKIITTYLNGIENGLYQKIESNGKILEKGNMTNGVKTGLWIEGNGMDNGNYVNGKRHGAWEIYQDGWECDGGITKGNFENGERVGTWTNLIVIGTKKPSPLVLNNEKDVAIPGAKGYISLEAFYKPGYKAIFNNEGYYSEAYDPNGNPIKAK